MVNKILRPMLGTLRRTLTAVGAEKVAKEAPALGKAALRTVREDVREFGEHLRDVRAGK
jgi:hypothetical protein